jgi:hypothetical protein
MIIGGLRQGRPNEGDDYGHVVVGGRGRDVPLGRVAETGLGVVTW